MKYVAACALAVASVGSLPAASTPQDETSATTYQINANHDGSQPGMALTLPLAEAWRRTFDDEVSYPLIIDGRVFVTVRSNGEGNQGARVYALDAATGAELWGPVEIGGSAYRADLAADHQHVYVINFDGAVYALDPATGATRWSRLLPDRWFTSPPTVYDCNVYVGGNDTMYAIDGQTGNLLWTANAGSISHSAAVVSEDAVYVSVTCLHAYRWDRVTGARQWVHTTGCTGGGGKTAVLHDGELFARDHGSDLVIDAATGQDKRVFQAGPAPAFIGKTGFFSQADWVDRPGPLSRVDQDTGLTRWTQTGDGTFVTAPIVAGGYVFVGGTSGLLAALDPDTGAIAWSANVGSAIYGPDEHNMSGPLQGLAAGGGLVIVPATSTLVAYESGPPRRETRVVVTSSANPSAAGQPVTVEAKVSPIESAGETPTGAVQFSVDGVAQGDPSPLDSDGAASTTIDGLGAGDHAIVASYLGDTLYGLSNGSLVQTVLESGAPMPTQVTADPAIADVSFRRGSALRLRATLTVASSDIPVPGRTIVFRAGGDVLCSAQTGPQGGATCDVPTALIKTALARSYTAKFRGDAAFGPSTNRGGLIRIGI